MVKHVKVYVIKDDARSQSVCNLLDEINIKYQTTDVSHDEDAIDVLVKETGQWSAPAVVVTKDNEPYQIVVGYDPESIRSLFKSEN